MKRIRVLVVDDSALARKVISEGLAQDPAIEVVGTAPDAYIARDKIVSLQPDVMTLDVDMPRLNGVDFLRRLMPQHPLPVVMVSALTERGKQVALDALAAGAVDIVTKPQGSFGHGFEDMLLELRTKIKVASTARVAHWKLREPVKQQQREAPVNTVDMTASSRLIVLGASTGGTEAIAEIISRLPPKCPAVIAVQHMPAGFTSLFAQRLNRLGPLTVTEASDGQPLLDGHVYVAPGGRHLRVQSTGSRFRLSVLEGDLVCGHCPSVEVAMQSVARAAGDRAIGAVLTGMGRDGAEGLRAMRQVGARTFAQDEASSVVFGMPREAYARGGAEALVPLNDIPGRIVRLLREWKA